MSYVLHLYRKDHSKNPFTETELKNKLGNSYGYVAVHSEKNLAVGFDIGKTEVDSTEFYHQGNDKGYYGTYCSYGIDEKEFMDFKRIVKDIAITLNLQIQDPQISENLIEPENFIPDDTVSSNRFTFTKQATKEVIKRLPWILTTKSKHFILYFIMSTDPVTHKNLFLTIGEKGMYASKVEPGESIDQVVKREIPELTGGTVYKILQAKDYDTARDRYGNELPRYSVIIEVPYFDPIKKTLKQKVDWQPL